LLKNDINIEDQIIKTEKKEDKLNFLKLALKILLVFHLFRCILIKCWEAFIEAEDPEKNINKTDLMQNISLVLYYMSNQGPDFVEILSSESFKRTDLITFGTFFYIALGQGSEYSQGLYELPVRGFKNHHSLIFAFTIHDPNFNDPRAKFTNYCLLSVIMPKDYRELIYQPAKIEKSIKKLVNAFNSLVELKDRETLKDLLQNIFQVLLENKNR
jgi:hypothetical protein